MKRVWPRKSKGYGRENGAGQGRVVQSSAGQGRVVQDSAVFSATETPVTAMKVTGIQVGWVRPVSSLLGFNAIQVLGASQEQLIACDRG